MGFGVLGLGVSPSFQKKGWEAEELLWDPPLRGPGPGEGLGRRLFGGLLRGFGLRVRGRLFGGASSGFRA